MSKSIFENFTNLYALSKTLRFELKPTPETKSLEEVIKKDKEIDDLYNEEMKPMFDKLHEKFINESLENASLPIDLLKKLENQITILKELSKDRKTNRDKIYKMESDGGEISKLQKKLREDIVSFFIKKGNDWKENKYSDVELKKDGYKILAEKNILMVLIKENPQKENIVKEFKGFFTYFSGFNQNKENYYSNEAKSTSIANRIVNENLIRFLDNKQKFQNLLEKIPQLSKFKNEFSLESFNQYLNQDGIEKFNLTIGEINKQVNLFSQQHENILPKALKLKNLKKQIGCGKKENFIFIIEEKKEWEKIQELIDLQYKKVELYGKTTELLNGVSNLYTNFFDNYETYELDKIYFNKQSINTISSFWFSNWLKLSEILAAKKIIKNKDKNKEYTIPEKISLLDLKEVLENEKNIEDLFKRGRITEEEAENAKKEKREPKGEYEKLFTDNAWKTLLAIWQYEINNNFEKLAKLVKELETFKKIHFEKKDRKMTIFIKGICDAFLAIERMIKYHKVKEETVKDDDFYVIIDLYLQETNLRKYYDAFRNYLTKKPFSEDKIKLNFENGQLLGGLSDGQEKNKGAVILKNDNKFYLGILKDRGFFRTDRENKIYNIKNSDWKRLILKNLKFQTLAGRGFGEGEESYGNVGKEKPMQAVALLQEIIRNKYIKKYPALKDVSEKKYKTKKEFDSDIVKALEESFDMHFDPIDKNLLFEGAKQEKLFLFEIVNKDLNGKTGDSKKNVHSLYWIEMLSDANLKNLKIILNGGGEIFFRRGQKEKLNKKIDKKGKEVIDAKRYADDKNFLHIPITINYGKPKAIKFKSKINNCITNNLENIHVLGIDRGEKHLLYYSLIKNSGEIIKQGSFNQIMCGDKMVDYGNLLSVRAKEMKDASQSWETIGKIKDLKEGYLSQVIYEIYKIVIGHNAIIVLEDLNSEFKAKRIAKVEKSVYTKFELALAKKLNHLVLKNRNATEIGGVLNAYQLTPPIVKISDFEKAKQWGIMFYVRPDYTSTIDPVTGWRKTIYVSNSASQEEIKKLFDVKNGVKISFDNKKKCFKFSYEKWNLYAYSELTRFYWNRNEKNPDGGFGNMKKYNLYEELKKLFSELDVSKNINEQILNKSNFNWKSLIFYWNLLNQIRNTDKSKDGDENDFIQSSVWSDKINDFYDSRKKYQTELPKNGDANGAYNIARKGIMLLNEIQKNPEKPDLFIKNTDWDKFAQK